MFERLTARNLALCVADSEKLSTPVRVTADYAYFRLRDEGYTPDDIATWAEIIERETAACRDVFVYFKHEEAGKGAGVRRGLLGQRLGLAGVGAADSRRLRHEVHDRVLGPVAVVIAVDGSTNPQWPPCSHR